MSVRNANVNARVGGYTRCRRHYVTLAAATTSANSRSTGTLERLYAQPPTLASVGVDSVAADVHIAGYIHAWPPTCSNIGGESPGREYALAAAVVPRTLRKVRGCTCSRR